jgi:uncharacterized protein
MTHAEDEHSFLEALRQAHEFPCRYTFKVIGENTTVFMARAIEVVRLVLPRAVPETSTRESRYGKAQSVTLVVEVPSAELVVAIHKGLGRIPGTKLVL